MDVVKVKVTRMRAADRERYRGGRGRNDVEQEMWSQSATTVNSTVLCKYNALAEKIWKDN